MRRWIACLAVVLLCMQPAMADEGMWLMHRLAEIYPQMKARGLKIKDKEIYTEKSAALADAVVASGAKAVRITPWRQLLLEAARSDVSHKLDSACTDSDALAAAGWQVEACAGAPYCVQAGVDTRALALRLAAAAAQGGLSLPAALADAPRLIHVSGCAKGCAHAGPAAICLTGRGTAFDLAFDARPGEPVHAAGLSPAAVLERLGVH